MPNWDHEDLKGSRKMSGEVPCEWCGNYYCGWPGLAEMCKGREMSLRDKTIKPERTKEFVAFEDGKNATKYELEAYLTAYTGDDFFARQFADCLDLIRKKNADYSQGEQKGDRIAAFRRLAKDNGITMEQVWGVLCGKHLGAVHKFIKEGIVESEHIEGRIHDVINYMILLAAIIDDGKKVGHGG